jgi:hypothetical protein
MASTPASSRDPASLTVVAEQRDWLRHGAEIHFRMVGREQFVDALAWARFSIILLSACVEEIDVEWTISECADLSDRRPQTIWRGAGSTKAPKAHQHRSPQPQVLDWRIPPSALGVWGARCRGDPTDADRSTYMSLCRPASSRMRFASVTPPSMWGLRSSPRVLDEDPIPELGAFGPVLEPRFGMTRRLQSLPQTIGAT